MPRRSKIAAEVVGLIGPGATLVDAGSGWPSIIDLELGRKEKVRLAAYLGPVHSMSRKGSIPLKNRPDELRFQTPGSNRPTALHSGMLSLLIGVLPSIDGDPSALVVPEGLRVGQTTRYSVRFPGSLAYEGARSGWATHPASGGESFWAIAPRLLPSLAVALLDEVEIPVREIRTAVRALGSLDDEDPEVKERTRIATTRLARSAVFRSRVFEAYEEACALCDISLGAMLEAAHLFPVNLPGSSDVRNNGVPLCLHHHALFDSRLLHISPETLAVTVSPELKRGRGGGALAAFIEATREELTIPAGISRAAAKRWLTKRNEAFASDYEWAHKPS